MNLQEIALELLSQWRHPRIVFLVVIFSVNVGNVSAQQSRPPRFTDFPVTHVFTGKPTPVDFRSSPQARKYRTELRRNARRGTDFAGHYKVAQWGCGSACLSIAIIDLQTGRVEFPPQLLHLFLHAETGAAARTPLQYRADSALLIATGVPVMQGKNDGDVGRYYYQWEQNRLQLIHVLKKGEQE